MQTECSIARTSTSRVMWPPQCDPRSIASTASTSMRRRSVERTRPPRRSSTTRSFMPEPLVVLWVNPLGIVGQQLARVFERALGHHHVGPLADRSLEAAPPHSDLVSLHQHRNPLLLEERL